MKPERTQRRRAIKSEEKKLTRKARTASKTWRDAPFRILFRWILVLSAVSLTALQAVAHFSPLFEVRAISVVGEQRVAESELLDSLEPLLGSNLLQVSDEGVAELLQDHPLVESFALQAIPPNELQVRVRERQPLLVLADANQEVLVDVTGMAIALPVSATDYESLPKLRVQSVADPGPEFATAVSALLAFPNELFQQVSSLEVSAGKTLTIQLRQPAIRVIWGGPEEAPLKYEVLLSLLANQDNDKIEIDVTTPRSPVVRYLDF